MVNETLMPGNDDLPNRSQAGHEGSRASPMNATKEHPMIDLLLAVSPVYKITMFLEESGLDYTIHPVPILGTGEQFEPRLPQDRAQQPHARPSSTTSRPIAARPCRCSNRARSPALSCGKIGQFIPAGIRGWPVGSSVAVLANGRPRTDGEARITTSSPTPRAHSLCHGPLCPTRPAGSTACLDRLADRLRGWRRLFVAMASYPWIVPHERQKQDLNDFPTSGAGSRVFASVRRPGDAYDVAERYRKPGEQVVNDGVAQDPLRPDLGLDRQALSRGYARRLGVDVDRRCRARVASRAEQPGARARRRSPPTSLSTRGDAVGTARCTRTGRTAQSQSHLKKGHFYSSRRDGCRQSKGDLGSETYRTQPGPEPAGPPACEGPRMELFRRINMAGHPRLVSLRELLLRHIGKIPNWHRSPDSDLQELLTGWFNPGFLQPRPDRLVGPASLLEKLMRATKVLNPQPGGAAPRADWTGAVLHSFTRPCPTNR
ncbi:MAG: malonyl-CoA decarboxylase N-terminal domain-containing protein [Geminicoccaceae bacterium]